MNYQRPRGTADLFGNEIKSFKKLEEILRIMSTLGCFHEIQTPTFEHLELFNKSVGETSDIVTKELYTFQDKGQRWLALRPEGTAGVVRAYVENKMYGNQNKPLKLFYFMNLFRYERPQGGRMREFHQFGVEILGVKNYLDDVELLIFANTILEQLKIKDVQLHINNLGNFTQRLKWIEALKNYFADYKDQLSEDSLNRLEKNPLRILDDKIDGQKEFVKKAPKLLNYLDDNEKQYFKNITNVLDAAGIQYVIDDTLVRGLDYYTGLVFEFVSTSNELVGKATILGGGRYSKLIKDTGGPDLEGIGFAIGMERLLIAINKINPDFVDDDKIDVLLISDNTKYDAAALLVTKYLRSAGLITDIWNGENKRNKNIKLAKNSHASYVVFVNDKLTENLLEVEQLSDGQKSFVKINEIADFLKKRLEESWENSNGSK